jgi:hypothetical protein
MPQDNLRSDSQRTENSRGESTCAERSRGERSPTASTMSPPMAELGVASVTAGWRRQKEMFDVVQDIGKEWLARATSEAELAFKLPNKLTAARSVPDALSAYHDWLGEWMDMCGEDSRRFASDTRKIIDAGVRCFGGTAPSMTS